MVLHFVYVLAKQYIFITDGFLTGGETVRRDTRLEKSRYLTHRR